MTILKPAASAATHEYRARRAGHFGVPERVLFGYGTAYLAHLRERHIANLEDAFSLPQRPSFTEQAEDPSQFRDQASFGGALMARRREPLS